MTESERIIKFDKNKDFRFIKVLGRGGTGETVLLLDETTDIRFAFKKYSPSSQNDLKDNYARFVDEIKILFKIYHPNIVRIYNYYLYPERTLGYIQMEYVEGVKIDEYDLFAIGNDWNRIFSDLISAFHYLEINKILHRDIRPANILIDSNACAKIIDFGFGKILEIDETDASSVLLNWPVSELPDEITQDRKYTTQSEIYFLGKLFRNLGFDENSKFSYEMILDKMIPTNPDSRYASFKDILDDISKNNLKMIKFTDEQKSLYRSFAEILTRTISKHLNEFVPIRDSEVVVEKLSRLVSGSLLEESIQNNRDLLSCFLVNNFYWNSSVIVNTALVKDFLEMFSGFDIHRKQTVLDNISLRLGKEEIRFELDLPW